MQTSCFLNVDRLFCHYLDIQENEKMYFCFHVASDRKLVAVAANRVNPCWSAAKLDKVGLADSIKAPHCRPPFISLMKCSGYHGPACQLIRLSWLDISSGKPWCAKLGEIGSAVVSSRPRLTHRAMRVVMLIADQRPETNPCFSTKDLPMCTSYMGRHTCST